MSSVRALTRLVDDRHPIAGWLFRAAGLPINGTLVMSFADEHAATRAAAALAGFRRKGRLGPPGSFDETAGDPHGEGIGYFSRVVISRRGKEVRLRHLPDGHASLRAHRIEPINVSTLDPEDMEPPRTCSHVNPEAFDVVA